MRSVGLQLADSVDDASKFSKTFHSPGVGIAWPYFRVAFFIAHGMTVIRPHGNLGKIVTRTSAVRFLLQEGAHQTDDVIVSVKMFRLIEGPIWFAPDVPQVYKLDMLAELPDHCDEVVV